MDDFGSIVGYGVVVLVMAVMIYAVVVFECMPRRRRVEQDHAIAMANTVATARPALDPADNDICFHNCANCGVQFYETNGRAAWTRALGAAQRVWYCSTACADAMPFLPDPDAQAYAQYMRAQLEREMPGRSSSVYTEAIRLRRLERRRVNDEMLRTRQLYGSITARSNRRLARGERMRPSHFTGQEPEDL